MTDTGSVTGLLAIIAIATTVQALVLAGAAVMMLKAYREAMARMHALERQLLPALDKVDRVLDAIEDTTTRIRGVEDGIRHTVAETREVARRSLLRFKADWWPVFGAAKAATAAIHAFRRPARLRPLQVVSADRARASREDDDKGRFDYEGGIHARK